MARRKPLDAFTQGWIDLNRRLAAGDPAAAELLAKVCASPADVEAFGNLARLAEARYLATICGEDLVKRAFIETKLKALRAELAGPAPQPLETLLAERIVVCHLQAHYADTYAPDPGDKAPALADFTQRWQSRCHTRLLNAIKTLAQVRRLLQPMPSTFDFATQALPEGPPQRRSSRTAAESVAN